MNNFTLVIEDTNIIVVPTNLPPTIPRYKFVGRTTTDTLYNKTITDPSNTIAATSLIVSGNTITITGGSIGGVLTMTTAATAAFLPSSITGGTFIDNTTTIVNNIDNTKVLAFSIGGNPSTSTTLSTSQTINRNFITPDIDGTALVAQTGTGQVFIGRNTTDNGSNAGLQFSTLVANRAQFRGNQYGNNGGVPGITTLKSRGTTIGDISAPVIAGDIIYGATGIGVAPGSLIPLSFLSRCVVATVGASWIATEYEMSLVPLVGPTNGVRKVFGVSSEGMQRVRESSDSMGGIAVLDAGGSAIIANTNIKTSGANTSRILLTVQDGVVPTGNMYIFAKTNGVSFEIRSTAGAADSGVNVYYQIYESIP
jgi:hypothetical protein